MTAEKLAEIAGIGLSLIFAYAPKIKEWYEKKNSAEKVQWMGIALVAAALVIFGLSCSNLYVSVECSKAGALGLLAILFAALKANVATFIFAVRPFQKKSEPVG